MFCQLITDCLNNTLEYLEDDKNTLYSCLLVNRQWCKIAVRILWRDVWSFQDKQDASLSIINTLITFLPEESKNLLQKEKFLTIIPNQKPPLFNYPSFIKAITIYGIYQMIIERFPLNLRGSACFSRTFSQMHSYILLELLKMFMCQISSLKFLDYYSGYTGTNSIAEFIYLPETKICLKNLTELWCCSDICSDFFYQISQICHNIKSLSIKFDRSISDGLTDLISSQNNLKNIFFESYYYVDNVNVKVLIPSLTKFSLTLTKLILDECYIPLSFVSTLENLQVLCFSKYHFKDFDQLQYSQFPQLRVLRFVRSSPKIEMLTKFLELNGKNLTEFYVSENPNNSLNPVIAKLCLNLKILSIIFEEDEYETFKLILNNCQYLEIIRFQYKVKRWNNYKIFFKILAKYAQKNFYELRIDWQCFSILLPFEKFCKSLEELFKAWKDRIPQKSLSLIITNCYGNGIKFKNHMEITFENYKKMGTLRKFRTTEYEEF
jgi:hypothetical protein